MATYYRDEFNGTALTRLEDHTPDVSAGSYVVGFNYSDAANHISLDGSGNAEGRGSQIAYYHTVSESPTPDQEVIASLRRLSGRGWGIVQVRFIDDGAHFSIMLRDIDIRMLRRDLDNGPTTEVALEPFNFNLNQVYDIRVLCEGPRIRIYIDDAPTPIIDYDSSAYTDRPDFYEQTRVGIGLTQNWELLRIEANAVGLATTTGSSTGSSQADSTALPILTGFLDSVSQPTVEGIGVLFSTATGDGEAAGQAQATSIGRPIGQGTGTSEGRATLFGTDLTLGPGEFFTVIDGQATVEGVGGRLASSTGAAQGEAITSAIIGVITPNEGALAAAAGSTSHIVYGGDFDAGTTFFNITARGGAFGFSQLTLREGSFEVEADAQAFVSGERIAAAEFSITGSAALEWTTATIGTIVGTATGLGDAEAINITPDPSLRTEAPPARTYVCVHTSRLIRMTPTGDAVPVPENT